MSVAGMPATPHRPTTLYRPIFFDEWLLSCVLAMLAEAVNARAAATRKAIVLAMGDLDADDDDDRNSVRRGRGRT